MLRRLNIYRVLPLVLFSFSLSYLLINKASLQLHQIIDDGTSCPIPKFDFYDKWFFNVVEYAVNNTAVRPCSSPPKIFSKWTALPDRKGHVLEVFENATCSSIFFAGIRFGDADRGVPKLSNPSAQSLEKGVEVIVNQTDFLQISCTEPNGNKVINLHYQVIERPEVTKRATDTLFINPNLHHDPINIIMIGYDSVSRANSFRSLSKMHSSLRSLKNSLYFEFEKYSIVGDGTTANLIPLLTGFHHDQLYKPKLSDRTYVDEFPWIWKEFHKYGYVSAFLEDQPSIGAFQLRLRGWKKQPTDHYMRPFFQILKRYDRHNELTPCSHPEKEFPHQMQLNFAHDLINSYEGFPKFIMTYCKIAHSHPHNVKYADTDIVNFINKLDDEGHLNSSIVFIFGDHGSRWGPHRRYIQGMLEERLPMNNLLIPKWFNKVYPHWIENLNKNKNKLVTAFDIHKTWLHMFATQTGAVVEKKIGQSLFESVPASRTCDDASIPLHLCGCSRRLEIPIDAEVVKNGSRVLVKFINEMLRKEGEEKCVENLKLAKVNRAESLETKAPQENYQLQFETTPGGGIFEGTFVKHKNGTFTAEKYFSRVNAYGDLPCAPKSSLRQFCVCK